MLQYDKDWVVPGELEYAEQKASEIENQIKKHNSEYQGDGYSKEIIERTVKIQITEHILGIFYVNISAWEFGYRDVYNFMMLDWYQETIYPIDKPKIFELPEGDIRNELPEWDESFLSAIYDLYDFHFSQGIVLSCAEFWDCYRSLVKTELNINGSQADKIFQSLVAKLNAGVNALKFTELEEKVGLCFADKHNAHSLRRAAQWLFPLCMREQDIIDAIREAYQNAAVKSRRRIPDAWDAYNLDWYPNGYFPIEDYECLYQAKSGGMVIRFVFDFKNMKIRAAYPVPKGKHTDAEFYSKNSSN